MLTQNSNQSNSAISKALKAGALLAASLPSMAALDNYALADEGGSIAAVKEVITKVDQAVTSAKKAYLLVMVLKNNRNLKHLIPEVMHL